MSDISKCPTCGKQTLDSSSARFDICENCGYEFYYGDAHAPAPYNESKQVNPGDPNRERTADNGY